MKVTLKAARVNSGLSIRKAAKALGISTVTLQAYEGSKRYPNVMQVAKMEKLYNCKYSDIIFFTEDIADSDSEESNNNERVSNASQETDGNQ